jgi:hypothetical protein
MFKFVTAVGLQWLLNSCALRHHFWMCCMQYGVNECNILSLTQVLTPLRCGACHMVLVNVIHFPCCHTTYRLYLVCRLKSGRTRRLGFLKVLLPSVSMSLKWIFPFVVVLFVFSVICTRCWLRKH